MYVVDLKRDMGIDAEQHLDTNRHLFVTENISLAEQIMIIYTADRFHDRFVVFPRRETASFTRTTHSFPPLPRFYHLPVDECASYLLIGGCSDGLTSPIRVNKLQTVPYTSQPPLYNVEV